MLRTLSDFRFASVPQLRALHGIADRRLAVMAGASLLHRVFMPVRPFDRSVTSIFALARVGAEILAARGDGTVPSYLSSREERSALFLDHTLRRNDVRVVVELLSRRAKGFRLLAWRQAPDEVSGGAYLRTREGKVWTPCVPDGFAHVEVAGDEHGLAIEIDMGTVAPKRMERRFRAYYAWWKSGGMAERLGRMPLRVLTLTTTPARLARLQGAGIRAAPRGHGSGLFWFGLLSVADLEHPERLLTAGFHTARSDDTTQTLFT